MSKIYNVFNIINNQSGKSRQVEIKGNYLIALFFETECGCVPHQSYNISEDNLQQIMSCIQDNLNIKENDPPLYFRFIMNFLVTIYGIDSETGSLNKKGRSALESILIQLIGLINDIDWRNEYLSYAFSWTEDYN